MVTANEKWYAKYAWIVIFIFGLLTLIAAPINLLGTPPNPPSPEAMTGLSLSEMNAKIPGILNYISSISRQLGNFLLAVGVLLMGIAAVPYRKGEKWAWYICWILPVLLIIQLINSRGGLGWQADLIFLVVILGSLLLPYRKFFPSK
jgi:hypothetical protein